MGGEEVNVDREIIPGHWFHLRRTWEGSMMGLQQDGNGERIWQKQRPGRKVGKEAHPRHLSAFLILH